MNSQKHILLFGAGKSATVLIAFLKKIATNNNWLVTVADNNLQVVLLKVGIHPNVKALQLNIENETERKKLVQSANIVISMLPPGLHYLIALDCIEFGKHLLTASYVDERIQKMAATIQEKGLLFICEMGLDPGIDHMSAMKLIHQIKATGASILSFVSHCGGLVAPENDDNPWHYKISWNPRNVVLAGKAGAVYLENELVQKLPYEVLFTSEAIIKVPNLPQLSYYPNRDSLTYINLYGLSGVHTFLRTTLRYPDFILGWNTIVALQLTNETYQYNTTGLSIAAFLKMHFNQVGVNDRIQNLQVAAIADPEKAIILKQLNYLGLNDDFTLLPFTSASAADVLQFLLEIKLALKTGEKDMIVMLHQITYRLQDKIHRINSSLVVIGENDQETAMAKTVGLPLGIAAVLILEGKINETGLHIPILPSIYEPVLEELEKEGILFKEIIY